MADALPRELSRGRGNLPGPVTGNPVTLTLATLRAVGLGTTDAIRSGIIMPFALRLLYVTWCHYTAVTPNVSFSLHQHASAFSVAGSVDILSADIDLDANEFGVVLATGTPSLAVRNLARGERVFAAVTADGTGAIPATGNFCVSLHGYALGVVNFDAVND